MGNYILAGFKLMRARPIPHSQWPVKPRTRERDFNYPPETPNLSPSVGLQGGEREKHGMLKLPRRFLIDDHLNLTSGTL